MTYQAIQELVAKAVERFNIERQPQTLYEPIHYTLDCGGKRLRPTLTLLAYGIYADDVEQALTPAIAIETYHNHTLLHDDLMDNADMRRGKPTVHRKWNANTAILSGDTMLIYAMRTMLQSNVENPTELMDLFTETALQVCEGQQYDMEFESRIDVTEAEYVEMIRLKTSVLLACAVKAGAIMAGAPEEDTERLYRFGEELGIAFQLQDDWLDCYGDTKVFGKRIGGDILCGKKTYLLINALLRADDQQKKELEQLLTEQPEGEEAQSAKINAVKALYDQLGIAQLTEQEVERHFANAMSHLAQVSAADADKAEMKAYAETLLHRDK